MGGWVVVVGGQSGQNDTELVQLNSAPQTCLQNNNARRDRQTAAAPKGIFSCLD